MIDREWLCVLLKASELAAATRSFEGGETANPSDDICGGGLIWPPFTHR
ncbi:hypothetical protein N9W17_00125 [Jannaschia sp.]|nr:hypothetical protein [Jannaschia sp.]